ncbi:hypothetical protein D2V17_20650 [Aurantiacibacter xanthus]|uniref:Uncharacterized protein n=1 Tax=Aurantiacibacter xanthus TaxID=1784712 RepID=A0A3A1P026_9SPHN|nr:hypothetical protein D2V17_20650 [Aurantiacibacter xanthus]
MLSINVPSDHSSERIGRRIGRTDEGTILVDQLGNNAIQGLGIGFLEGCRQLRSNDLFFI